MPRQRVLTIHIDTDPDTEDKILDSIGALLGEKFPEAWPAGVIASRPDEDDDLADRRHFVLEPDAFDEFQRLLDAPVQASPKLAALFARPNRFDQ